MNDFTYKIIRFYENAGIRQRTIATGLTSEEARAHCNDPETSSSQATNPVARRRTREIGRWSDGYRVEE